ncbi:MAG TPA: MBL fold metallo-hydrolase [Opitutaceae bacterium]|nr:MBL fold metallo-hydrolase [Opitutaceae bacterium]
MNPWQEIEPGVLRRRDSCNLYAVAGRDGAWLLVNAGSGHLPLVLEGAGPGRLTVLLTHHFRDHTAGAARLAAEHGALIAAPWHERDHLAGEQRAFRQKPTQLLYDLTWDHFAPIAPLPVGRWMMDYERTTLAGLTVEVVPTPGVTMGAATYVVTLPSGRRLAFIGELMCAPGRLARLSPLQYNYNDLSGMDNVLGSWERVLAARPDLALPSLGEPFADCVAAVGRLRRTFAGFEALQPGLTARLSSPPPSGVVEVVPRLYRALGVSAEVHFLVGRAGRALAIDYGYDTATVRFPNRLDPWNRRPLLHSVDALRAAAGVERVATVLPTHYHDDHVAGVPLLQRLHGAEVWAGENFADLLERPQDFDRPCLWPEPIPVARRLPLDTPFTWEDVTITLHPMTGHTEFSTLVLLEFDGRRVAHTGDQLFFLDPAAGRLCGPGQGGVLTNHVYRNGLALGGYVDFIRRLRAFGPELILSGHFEPYRPDDALWARLETVAPEFDRLHREIMPLGENEIHFGPEGQAAKLVPHLLRLATGRATTLRGWVLNPFGRNARAEVRLATRRPEWAGVGRTLDLGPREKRWFELALPPVAEPPAGREPLALELAVEGRPFGQVAEAWLTAAGDNCH